MRLLHVEQPPPVRQYVRDPQARISPHQLFESYAEGVDLPSDAVFTGYRSGDLELWFTPDDRAAYVVSPDEVERWPRAVQPIGCT